MVTLSSQRGSLVGHEANIEGKRGEGERGREIERERGSRRGKEREGGEEEIE